MLPDDLNLGMQYQDLGYKPGPDLNVDVTNNICNNELIRVYKSSSKSRSYPMLKLDDIMLSHSGTSESTVSFRYVHSPNAIFSRIIFCAYCTTYQDSRLYTILDLLHKAEGNCCLK